MKENDFFEQYSQAVEMAECRIADFNKFIEIYNYDDKEYFLNKLSEMGYSGEEANSIVFNRDLLLTLFMNSFESVVVDLEHDTKINIDLEIETARKKYIDAVDIANESITAANEAKEIMFKLKKLLESKFGYDSNKWDEDSVHEMNEAIKIYNTLVEKANFDVLYSNNARKELADVRSKNIVVQDNDIVFETS